MWDFVDKVVYINLDHREDRRKIMSEFFKDGNIPQEKVIRFPAIKHSVGIVGCAMGHISILKHAKAEGWKSVLILEDDMRWIDFHSNYPKLKKLAETHWDVCMLGGLYLEHDDPRVKMAFCTNAYIVRSHYYDVLLDNFETGLRKKLDVKTPFISMNKRAIRNKLIQERNQYNVDVYWFLLQERDTWVAMIEPMCDQVPTYSDIYNQVVVHQDVDKSSLLPFAKEMKSLMKH
jgi:glycosyl transferase family 25